MNDFGRDDKPRTGGNRVGPWSPVKTSALGHKQTYAVQLAMSALGQKRILQLLIGLMIYFQAARETHVSISLRSAAKSIGLVNKASAPFSNALRFVSASP